MKGISISGTAAIDELLEIGRLEALNIVSFKDKDVAAPDFHRAQQKGRHFCRPFEIYACA
jgi:hypothetical protein